MQKPKQINLDKRYCLFVILNNMKTLKKGLITLVLLTGLLFTSTSCMVYGPPRYDAGLGIYLYPHRHHNGSYYSQNYGRQGGRDWGRDRDRDRDRGRDRNRGGY